ncbi:TfoX/Sxy family protein [Marinimicrobium sp. ABcell2]|uniref:TfoX/Sxy family protein n=1 Tax=Marinimicrobium sp. ABcell2 TaxID=3069751 RepID=UPI0027B11067|nr:TfoX/Sxy family protein [Marinimicrobium sp. ABcell2]MDQ2076948.1 TfoX/Sxy family protein [Marinimicrobium sp. ABcell2]
MAVSEHYLSEVLERLSQVAPVSYRRVFSGVAIYHRGVQFALIANDRLYFRVDDASSQPYIERNMPPLQPEAALTSARHYYQVPQVVLEESNELLYWMRAAVEAAPQDSDETAALGDSSSPSNTYRSLAG